MLFISHIINEEECGRKNITTMVVNISSNKHSDCRSCLYDRSFLLVALYVTLLNMTAAISVWTGSSIRISLLIMIRHM